MMDIKAKIDEIVQKIKSDDQLRAQFMKDPVAALEQLLGVDLPDDQLNMLADGVKAKLNLDSISGALGGLFGRK